MSYFKTSALLVWNGRNFWRIKGPDPKFMIGPLKIGRIYTDAPIGIYGFALSPKTDKTPQFLAMASLGSFHAFTATINDILSSEPKVGFFQWLFSPIVNFFRGSKHQENDTSIDFVRHEYVLTNPSAAFAFDSRGILFVGINSYTSLGCGNTTAKSTANSTFIPFFVRKFYFFPFFYNKSKYVSNNKSR